MSKLLHRSLEAKLAALDGPEWDSSDEEIDVPKKDTESNERKAKNTKNNHNKSNKNKNNTKANTQEEKKEKSSNIIYIGHIPPAFEETEILTFFSQFGRITNVKLSRSKRTGNPRGYAFVQFEDADVASIVADTMSGYFLKGERRLVCHVLPKEKIHDKLFQGAKRNLQLCQSGLTCSDKIKYWKDKERESVNKSRSMQGIKKITKRLLSREKKKREQLKMMGIDYDFPGYEASLKSVDDNTKEQKGKRKVSVDDSESASTPASSLKKIKKSNAPSLATKRKMSIDKQEEEDTQNRTESTETPNSNITKKKKNSNKKRRKST